MEVSSAVSKMQYYINSIYDIKRWLLLPSYLFLSSIKYETWGSGWKIQLFETVQQAIIPMLPII